MYNALWGISSPWAGRQNNLGGITYGSLDALAKMATELRRFTSSPRQLLVVYRSSLTDLLQAV